jgi:hypothetical protein
MDNFLSLFFLNQLFIQLEFNLYLIFQVFEGIIIGNGETICNIDYLKGNSLVSEYL